MFSAIRKIIIWTGDQRTKVVTGFLFSILSLFCGVVPFMVVAITIYDIYLGTLGQGTVTMSHVWRSLGLIVASLIVRTILEYIRAILQDSASYTVSEQERIKVGDRLKRVPLGFFSKQKTGEINTVMTTELSFFEMQAMSIVDLVANSYIFVILIIIYFTIIEPIIGLIALLGLLMSTYGITWITRVTKKNVNEKQEAIRGVTEATIEYTRGMSVIKSYNQQGKTSQKFRDACARSRDINIKFEKDYGLPNFTHKIGLYLGTCGIMSATSLIALNGELPMSMWIMMTLYGFTMFQGVEGVNESALVSQMVNTTIDKLNEISNIDYIDANGSDIEPQNYDIELKDVRFSYENQEVIKGISLTIPERSTLAIVGASGSGKTTLCSLLARFYDVDSGSITLGGEELRSYTCDSLLKHITMVFQNVYLFKDTIENNIRFGKPDATKEEVIDACKKARCYDFIMELEDGFDTIVGEGGNTLSGGEKQRISIARAMLKNASIVILDEATASVDPENEFYIQAAISELTKGKTVIIIAHRLKTIQNAEKIIVIDDGQIVQQGRHADLINQEGIYKRFVDIRKQSENFSLGEKR